MKKRILSFLLALSLLGSATCAAAEPVKRMPSASLYLDAYAIGIVPKGNLKMSVTFYVYGTDTMDCLGAQQILIEEWDGFDWEETSTLTAVKNPEFYGYKLSEYTASAVFYGLPGVQYRATLTAYAELDGGSGTGTVTCDPRTCY